MIPTITAFILDLKAALFGMKHCFNTNIATPQLKAGTAVLSVLIHPSRTRTVYVPTYYPAFSQGMAHTHADFCSSSSIFLQSLLFATSKPN